MNYWCHPILHWVCDYLSLLSFKLIHVSKRAPRCVYWPPLPDRTRFPQWNGCPKFEGSLIKPPLTIGNYITISRYITWMKGNLHTHQPPPPPPPPRVCWSTVCHFYPRPVLAFGYCRCLRLCVCAGWLFRSSEGLFTKNSWTKIIARISNHTHPCPKCKGSLIKPQLTIGMGE